MTATQSPVLVLHHRHGPGLAKVLASLGSFESVSPVDDIGVHRALADGADGLITYVWDDSFLDHELVWVQAISAGIDQFPLDRLRELGMILTSAKGAHSPAVADHAVALLLALLRRVGPAVRRSVDHLWKPEMAYETEGLTVGIVGLGSIGEETARRLLGLGMKVIGVKRSVEEYSGIVSEVVPPDNLVGLFRRCDAIILTLPSAPDTAGLVTAEHLKALEGGWIVNVGRGSVIDEDALIEALKSGTIRGAGLDVTATEPLPDTSQLWDMPEVIITPHMAWASERLSDRLATIIDANARAFTGRGDWVNRVV
ncbi:MAG: D-2-hydroxyacid dehydrogenase [Acidimicrobiia bacterium]